MVAERNLKTRKRTRKVVVEMAGVAAWRSLFNRFQCLDFLVIGSGYGG